MVIIVLGLIGKLKRDFLLLLEEIGLCSEDVLCPSEASLIHNSGVEETSK